MGSLSPQTGKKQRPLPAPFKSVFSLTSVGIIADFFFKQKKQGKTRHTPPPPPKIKKKTTHKKNTTPCQTSTLVFTSKCGKRTTAQN